MKIDNNILRAPDAGSALRVLPWPPKRARNPGGSVRKWQALPSFFVKGTYAD